MFKLCIPGKALLAPTLSRVPITVKQLGARPFPAMAAAITQVSDAIMKDHRELETYYDKIINATHLDTKARCQSQFAWELARHSVGEELVVYPTFQKHLRRGREMAEKDRAENQVVN